MSGLGKGPSLGGQVRNGPFEPDDGAVSVQRGIVFRPCDAAAAGGNHQPGLLAQIQEDSGLHGPEGVFAILGNNLGDGPPGSFLQNRVRVQKFPVQGLGQGGADGGLSAAGHTDENDVLHL